MDITKKSKLYNLDINGLILTYIEKTTIQCNAIENGDYKTANKATDQITLIYNELKNRGKTGQEALLPLLQDKEPGVRLWAASHTLEFSPSHGEPVLNSLIPIGKFIGFSAKKILEAWHKNKLNFQ